MMGWRHQSALNYCNIIALYDKGGKVYVTDAEFFEFFTKVSSFSSELLSIKTINAFKIDPLSVVYNKIKNNASLQESFLHLTNDVIADNSSIADDKSAHENGTFNEVQDTTSLLSPATPDNEVVVDDIDCVIENEILHEYLTNELSLDDDLVADTELDVGGQPSDCLEIHDANGEYSTGDKITGNMENISINLGKAKHVDERQLVERKLVESFCYHFKHNYVMG